MNNFTFSKKERRTIAYLILIGIASQYLSFQSKVHGINENFIVQKIDSSQLNSPKVLKLNSIAHDKTEKNLSTKQHPPSTKNEPKQNNHNISYPTPAIKKTSKPINDSNHIDSENMFDPNNLDSLGWLKLNLKPWVVSNILKYKRKGGFFKNCEALQKIYGLEAKTYQQLLQKCTIKQSDLKPNNKTNSQHPKTVRININKADTSEFKAIYGIGSKLSKRIVKYRQNLGGFHNVEQLKEVYGIEPELVDSNKDAFFVEGNLKKININEATKQSMAKHYYINFKTAQAILNYKHQHGAFQTVNDLKKIKLISEDTFDKIMPYLTTQ